MLGRDKVCAVVAAPDANSMLAQLRLALGQSSTVELRLDWLSTDREIDSFLRELEANRSARNATLIATCRRRAAGGRYAGTIARQLVHLADAIRSGCAWYDLEIETVRQCPSELIRVLLGEGRQLASAHFFERMPKNLSRVAAELRRDRPAAIKIAAL
jgi:3-dehydroquinate dehydratase / shikimate dehydrogenase